MKAQGLQELVTVFNTKGGIVFVLLIMWFITLSGTVAFGIWVISKGIDPQHAIVITILGMLVSQAFGNVNGALFTAFKGEDPQPLSGMSSTYTKTLTHDLPSDASKTVHPIQPLPPKNPSSQASPTRSSPDFNVPTQAPDAIETQINIQTQEKTPKPDFPGWKAPVSNSINSPAFKAVIRPKADK